MDNNINYNTDDARRASSIEAADIPTSLELNDFIAAADRYFKGTSAEDYLSYNDGKNKNAHVSFKPSAFLKSINLILYNILKDSNKSNVGLLRAYFDGLNEQLKVLDNMNLKLAEKRFICNIIGYTINCYKNNTFKNDRH
tara:strand:- start:116 stop:535 length:420 start_codon:yes stop_codon:yes gene_type:complete